jgi:enoyl-CoA hydratase
MSLIEEPTVALDISDEIATIIVNRPDNLNALNPDVLQGIILALEKIQKSADVRALVVTGRGEKAFVAGADVVSMAGLGPRPIADYVELGQRALRAIECFPVPVIAAVNGYALGGGLELALACDIIIAAETAKAGQPEINLGIIPGFGGTQRLIQRCGIGAARRLILTGDMIDAAESLRIGLFDQVVAGSELATVARAMAKRIASKAPLAVKEAKKIIRQSQEQQLLSGLRLEVEGFLSLFSSRDREEGMDAFMQKRPAKFTGR